VAARSGPADVNVCPRCGSAYGADARFCPRDGASLRAPTNPGDLVGQVIADRYHVLRKLGEGAMGQVYLAEHVKMGRECAVKVMHPALLNDADAVSRFNREASNASRIVHSNVATVFDFGETPDGITYLAMEYVDGGSVGALLRREGMLAVPRAVGLARQMADALAAAHDLGIVHRDLKPENVMVTRGRSGRESVKVVDFGIAKAAGQAQHVTQTGLVIGTPDYMSPEQLGGAEADARTDVYALGCILYEMLTGEKPFAGPGGEVVAVRRLIEPSGPPSLLRPDLPAALDAAVVRALALSPADRFQTASEFGEALAALHLDGGVTAPPATARRPPTEPSALGAAPARAAAAAAAAPAAAPIAAPPAPPQPTRRAGRWVTAVGVVLLAAAAAGVGVWFWPSVAFENRLAVPVTVTLQGRPVQTVAPRGVLTARVPRRRVFEAWWTAVPPAGERGRPMGEPVAGHITRAFGTDLTVPLRVRAEAFSDGAAYFAPLITNETGRPLRVVVNWSLRSPGGEPLARECPCTVPPGAVRYPTGYYLLYRNSTVQVVDPDGATATFVDFSPSVRARDGTVGLRFAAQDLRLSPARSTSRSSAGGRP
jgi:eukaryotic-like serine/threonine-protein kinase